MVKRKHDELEEEAHAGSPAPTTGYPDKRTAKQVKKLYGIIDASAKVLHTALKTARGFERQKLGRRIKTARANNDRQQWNRLENEVEALKSLDLSLVSQKHIYKTLQRTKRIAEHPAFQHLRVSKELAAPPASNEEANVTARLYNSNPVKQALPDFVKDVKHLLALDDRKPDVQNDRSSVGQGTRVEGDEAVAGADSVGAGDAESDVEDEFTGFDSRIASASDSESSGNDGGNDDFFTGGADEPDSAESGDEVRGAVAAESEGGQEQASDSIAARLPSLALGGYWSGSESEPEDDIPELGGGRNGKPQRRNRMGQQARRALWEKKFGKEAKHLQRTGGAKSGSRAGTRDDGWDPQRGATDRDLTRRGVGRSANRREGRGDRRADRGRSERPPKQQHRDAAQLRRHHKAQDDKPVHPSWEAKRKAREAMQAKLSSFQGKKITFD
ncbi:hypothetical protein KEM52_000857 [Ascosphaera acerosa]|nr:hypothetical protein KEM52_000857 [Ascosphaera acerosa]